MFCRSTKLALSVFERTLIYLIGQWVIGTCKLQSILSLTFRHIQRLNTATVTTSTIAADTAFHRQNGFVFVPDTRCRLCFVLTLFCKLHFC